MKKLSEITRGFTETTLADLPLADFDGDPAERWQAIQRFLQPFLEAYQNPLILDAAMGSGPDTIALLEAGFRVISNEIDEIAIAQACDRALTAGVKLEIRRENWIRLLESDQYPDAEFDVIISLGNSFPTYLLEDKERSAATKGFWRILKPGGTLIFDARNYDYILRDAEHILADPEKNFRYEYRVNYLGRYAHGFPVAISADETTIVWKNYHTRHWARLNIWPATIANIRQMIARALGSSLQPRIYFDYQDHQPQHYDFAQFVLHKA